MSMTSTISLAETIADSIRRKILTGHYRPGDRLPTEEQLVQECRVSRGTVRNAYRQLISDGLVVSQVPRGHFVRAVNTWDALMWRLSDPENNVSTDDGPQDTWARCVREQGRVPSEEIRTEIVMADERAQHHLALSGPVPLLARRRRRYVDGEPSATADSFYLREHVAGTPVELPEQVYPGVYAVFAERGLAWARTVDQVGARAPTREEARVLRISAGTPVVEVIRVSWTGQGLPVRVTVFILPGDRYKALYEHRGEGPE